MNKEEEGIERGERVIEEEKDEQRRERDEWNKSDGEEKKAVEKK